MTLRVCAAPGCPNLQRESRCQTHRREREQARGTRGQRGYDTEYDAARRDYQRRMDAGELFACWRCHELGKPHSVDPVRWHLGHDNDDRRIIRGPQCPESNLGRPGGGG